MAAPLHELEAQVLSLGAADRARLLERLIDSFEPDWQVEEAWVKGGVAPRGGCEGWQVQDGSRAGSARTNQSEARVSYWLDEEAERELGDAGVFYAEHSTPKIAIAFLTEFER
jgi:hypothetical protein